MSEIPQVEAGDTVHMELLSADGNEMDAEVEVLAVNNDSRGWTATVDLKGNKVTADVSGTVSELQSVTGIGSLKSGGTDLGNVLTVEVL